MIFKADVIPLQSPLLTVIDVHVFSSILLQSLSLEMTRSLMIGAGVGVIVQETSSV